MEVGSSFLNHQFINALNSREEIVTIDENGWATFPVKDKGIAVYVLREMKDQLKD